MNGFMVTKERRRSIGWQSGLKVEGSRMYAELATKTLKVQGQVIKPQIWDTGGQERHLKEEISSFYGREQAGHLLERRT
ncbi:hypothetical protein F2Q70_00044165 [Brassica cretica]|uniref:Uncharacterized protein n=1 Tax=Brassica cretica TaxID=69181 RepID=A0A8S9KH87_BRACR|nr:hypothetical protein F2Q70_00044165 [Brassica cretica]